MVTATAAHGNYNFQYYANEALLYLQGKRGILKISNRAYDQEIQAARRGDRIKIKQPASIAVKDQSDLSYEALGPRSVDLLLDTYKHASFAVDDIDTAFTGDSLLEDHIFPAVDSLATAIEQDLYGLVTEVGPFVTATTSMAIADLTAARAKLMRNKCPVDDIARMHVAIGSEASEDLLNLTAFSQWQGAGATGVETQMRASMGQKFGFNIHESIYIANHTAGAGVTASAPKMQGAQVVGATSFTIDDGTLTGAVAIGDIITIAHTDGTTRDYAIASAASASGNAIAITISRGLVKAVANDAAVSFTTASKQENFAFHENALGFAMAPLPATTRHLASAMVARAVDPQSGLSLRLATGWDMDTNEQKVRVDCLYGVKVLDDSLACRIRL